MFPVFVMADHSSKSVPQNQNSSVVIKYKAVGHPVLKTQKMSDAIAGVAEKPASYVSA